MKRSSMTILAPLCLAILLLATTAQAVGSDVYFLQPYSNLRTRSGQTITIQLHITGDSYAEVANQGFDLMFLYVDQEQMNFGSPGGWLVCRNLHASPSQIYQCGGVWHGNLYYYYLIPFLNTSFNQNSYAWIDAFRVTGGPGISYTSTLFTAYIMGLPVPKIALPFGEG